MNDAIEFANGDGLDQIFVNKEAASCLIASHRALEARVKELTAALELIDAENDNPASFNSRIDKLIVEAIGRRDESVLPPVRRRAAGLTEKKDG